MGSDSEEDGETGSTIFFMILCLGSENSISFA